MERQKFGYFLWGNPCKNFIYEIDCNCFMCSYRLDLSNLEKSIKEHNGNYDKK